MYATDELSRHFANKRPSADIEQRYSQPPAMLDNTIQRVTFDISAVPAWRLDDEIEHTW
jgi:hypothetical protein